VGAAGVPVGVGFNRERNRGEGRKKKRRQVAPACQRHIEKEKGGGEMGRCGRERDGPVGRLG
jgi:hypothetical protein